jgi:hypothetical protein
MGQNFTAVLGHHLTPDDSLLDVLPEMLAPASAPKLALAIRHLVAIENDPPRADDEPWIVEEPRRPLFLNERGEAAPTDPPDWTERISERVFRLHVAEPVGWQPVSVVDRLAKDGWIEVHGLAMCL